MLLARLLRPCPAPELPENWTDTREALLEGVLFSLKYLGVTLVERPKGEELSAAAVKRIVATVSALGRGRRHSQGQLLPSCPLSPAHDLSGTSEPGPALESPCVSSVTSRGLVGSGPVSSCPANVSGHFQSQPLAQPPCLSFGGLPVLGGWGGCCHLTVCPVA